MNVLLRVRAPAALPLELTAHARGLASGGGTRLRLHDGNGELVTIEDPEAATALAVALVEWAVREATFRPPPPGVRRDFDDARRGTSLTAALAGGAPVMVVRNG
jgi:hypothetical protein